MTLNSVLVASGYDQSLTSSNNIENLTPNTGNPKRFKAASGGMVYFAVASREYGEGQERITTGGVSYVGFEQVIYTQPGCHPDAYAWLVANYRGLVTCQVAKDGTTYTQHNAELRFEKRPSQSRRGWYEVRWIFTLKEDI